MDNKQKNSTLYRFSGYQLPKVCLDEAGFPSYYMPPHIHPYFKNQPLYWDQDVFKASEAIMGPSSATAGRIWASRTMGGSYGSGSSISSDESSSKKSEKPVDTIDSIKSKIDSQKKCKKKLFSLVKI